MTREWVGCTLVFLLALLVRLLGISTRPIWYDEAFSVLFAEKGLKAMLVGTLTLSPGGAAADIHPLGYYTLLWGWMKLFGESLVSVRSLSILFGLGTVALAYLLMRAMFGAPRLALLGALAVALAPFQVHYSQEVRMYSMLALALAVATCAMWQGLHSRKWAWWLLFALAAALAEYSQELAAFFLVPLALTPVFLRRWDKVRDTLLAGLGALLLYLPWLVQLPAELAKIHNAYWVPPPTLANVFTTLLSFVTNLPVASPWLPLALTAALALLAFALYQTFRALHAHLPGARLGAWLGWLAFAPPVLMFAISYIWPVYLERGLIGSGVMFCLWVAWAVTCTGLPGGLRALNALLAAAAVVIGLVTHLTYAGFPYGPYAALDASLATRLQPGDVIIHSNKLTLLPSLYYDRTLPQAFIADPPGSSSDTLAPATQAVLGIHASPSVSAAAGSARRIWFIIFQESLTEAAAASLSSPPPLAWLDSHYHRLGVETWGPILVYVYAR
jgi:4-amino-4-deoxy-L-arabinose transferase-like glycosyltransferase